MSDAVIPFGIEDRATPGVSRIRQEVAKLKHEAKEASAAMHELGRDAARDMVGRSGARGLGAMAALGHGGSGAMLMGGGALLAAGLAKGALESWDERRVELARSRAERANKRDEMIESAEISRRQVASGGEAFAGSMRKMLSRGGSMEHARKLAVDGIDLHDAMAGISDLANVNDQGRASVERQARKLAATGEISFADAVKRMSRYGGGNVDMRRELLDIRGMPQTSENLAQAGTQLSFGGSSAARNIDMGVANGQTVGLAQTSDLLSGETSDANRRHSAQTLDPLGHAMTQMATAQERMARLLEAAAEAQLGVAAFAKDISSLIGGGEGSERSKLNRFRANDTVGGD